jgi:putative ABC transport system permease protein
MSIMIVMAVGSAAENLILSQVEGLGARTIAIAPGREPKGPADPAIIETLYGDALKERELKALQKKANAPLITEIMPVVFAIEGASYEGETFLPMVIGATELLSFLFDVTPSEGRFFTEDEVAGRNNVVVLGLDIKEEFFGGESAIGKKIKIKGVNLTVVGTLPAKGQVLFFNFDKSVVVPYTVAQRNIFGIKHFNRLIARVDSAEDIAPTVLDIERTIRELHNIDNPENDDFFVGTPSELTATVSTITGVLTSFLASVAAISLLVGGIGIMNIMLVSVAERTREIGLRKALGATRKNILSQFLLEATVITLTGGLIGILTGVMLAYIASVVLTNILDVEWAFLVPINGALLGLFVSVFVGIVFGIYPAMLASKKSPLEALKYE